MKILKLIFITSIVFLLSCQQQIDDDAPLPGSHADVVQSQVRIVADGWVAELPYDVPKPGSYSLSKINKAAGGTVLDVHGNELDLGDLLGDKIVLLTFIYSSCTDLNGCPLATAVFYKIKERFKENPKLA
ncbi:MAG: hypothetical protein AAF304_03415, partial [Pseudomonadota bacterium]